MHLLAGPVILPDTVDKMCALAIDGVSSVHTKRVYSKAITTFVAWHDTANRPGLNKAAVQAFRVHLELLELAPSTINIYLSAVRKLAQEAADNGLLDSALAAGIARVSGVRQAGVRAGKWLTTEEASALILAPDTRTLKGFRDRAMLALLVGCGLRRAELVSLRVESLEMREERWVIPDLEGKGRRLRTVPVPSWVKEILDTWLQRAEISTGMIFRRINKADRIASCWITADAVLTIVRHHGRTLGQNLAPHDLRRTCAKLCRSAGGSLEQIQMLLGHASIQTTERYLGSKQDLAIAVNDNLPISLAPGRSI